MSNPYSMAVASSGDVDEAIFCLESECLGDNEAVTNVVVVDWDELQDIVKWHIEMGMYYNINGFRTSLPFMGQKIYLFKVETI